MEVAALLADLRSCLRCDTGTGTAPLGVPHLGLQHVCKGTWGFVFWFGFSGTGIWNLCYWSPPVHSFLTSHPFHNNIHLHTSILSCHIVGLISGNVVSKIKDLFPFWKFSVDLCHLNKVERCKSGLLTHSQWEKKRDVFWDFLCTLFAV